MTFAVYRLLSGEVPCRPGTVFGAEPDQRWTSRRFARRMGGVQHSMAHWPGQPMTPIAVSASGRR